MGIRVIAQGNAVLIDGFPFNISYTQTREHGKVCYWRAEANFIGQIRACTGETKNKAREALIDKLWKLKGEMK